MPSSLCQLQRNEIWHKVNNYYNNIFKQESRINPYLPQDMKDILIVHTVVFCTCTTYIEILLAVSSCPDILLPGISIIAQVTIEMRAL